MLAANLRLGGILASDGSSFNVNGGGAGGEVWAGDTSTYVMLCKLGISAGHLMGHMTHKERSLF